MAEDIKRCAAQLPPLPEETVPGMSYVPFQQWSEKLWPADKALDAGTLFPVLDKPFMCGKK